MLALVNGMDVVKSIDLMGASLESPLTLMDVSSGQWDGCCEL